jgi:hypothetical protein
MKGFGADCKMGLVAPNLRRMRDEPAEFGFIVDHQQVPQRHNFRSPKPMRPKRTRSLPLALCKGAEERKAGK